MENGICGLALLVMAGALNACFALPMKLMGRWAWENIWLVWSGFALILLPFVSAVSFVPSIKEALLAGGPSLLFLIGICGFAWGVAQVLFGLAIDMIGVTLSFSIVLGLSAAVGSIVPFVQIALRRGLVSTDLLFAAALTIVLIGVFVCASAGSIRDRAKRESGSLDTHSHFRRGLACAVLSGLGAAAMNIGISLGAPIVQLAKAQGAKSAWSNTAVWLPLLWTGAIPNLIYCGILLRQNTSYRRFASKSNALYWIGGLIMALSWFASSIVYSFAAGSMGRFGLVIGWPVFMASIVITAGIVGVMTGEWKGAPRRALGFQATGVLFLILSILLFAQSNGKM